MDQTKDNQYAKFKGASNSVEKILKDRQDYTFDEYAHGRFGDYASTYSNPQYHRAAGQVSKQAIKDRRKDVSEHFAVQKSVKKQARKEYDYLVGQGKIKPPSQIERLERRAKGDPSLASVQAAQRVLEKRRARLSKGQSKPVKAKNIKTSLLREIGTSDLNNRIAERTQQRANEVAFYMNKGCSKGQALEMVLNPSDGSAVREAIIKAV